MKKMLPWEKGNKVKYQNNQTDKLWWNILLTGLVHSLLSEEKGIMSEKCLA